MLDPRTVIAFDLDDTLYKEWHYVHSGWMAVSRAMEQWIGGAIPAQKIYETMRDGIGHFDAAIALVKGLPGAERATIPEMVRTYRAHKPQIELPREHRRVLEELHRRGHTLAIITDGTSGAQRNKIEALGLYDFVDPKHVMVSEENGSDKTSPLPFTKLADTIGRDRSYIYVGDNPAKDFLHPGRLGWRTLMLADGEGRNVHRQDLDAVAPDYRPGAIIHSLTELLDLQ